MNVLIESIMHAVTSSCLVETCLPPLVSDWQVPELKNSLLIGFTRFQSKFKQNEKVTKLFPDFDFIELSY